MEESFPSEIRSEFSDETPNLSSLSEPFPLLSLPYEVILYLLQFCSLPEVLRVSMTCSVLYESLTRDRKYFIRCPAGYRLFPEQMQGYLLLNKYRGPERIFVQSPMASGKTALALMHALDSPKRTLIVIPVKTMTSWLDEIHKFHLPLSPDPLQSSVLIIHTQFPRHRDWAHGSSCDRLNLLPCKILLTTTHFITHPEYRDTLLAWKDEIYQTIFDEAHLIKPQYRNYFFDQFSRNLYLSATPMSPSHYTRYFVLGKKNRKDSFSFPPPPVVSVVPDMKFTFLTEDPVGQPMEQISNLLNAEEFLLRKLVLFTDWKWEGKELGQKIRALETACPRYRFLRFQNKSSETLKKFRTSETPCVLVCNYKTSTEGTNFEQAEGAIYLRLHKLSCKSAYQCFGRLRRRNNPHAVLQNYLILPTKPVAYIRAKLNAFCAEILQHRFEKKRKETIRCILERMEHDGVSLDSLTPAEYISIFGINSTGKPFPFTEKDYSLPWMRIIQYMSIF